MPKTWTKAEVAELMTEEARAYMRDCQQITQRWSYAEMMENVLGRLDEECLIEYTP